MKNRILTFLGVAAVLCGTEAPHFKLALADDVTEGDQKTVEITPEGGAEQTETDKAVDEKDGKKDEGVEVEDKDEDETKDKDDDEDDEEEEEEEPEAPALSKISAEEEKTAEISEEALKSMKETAEPHQFQAEVERMMGIIINSLYTEKEVFLRELISNAADALEKVRFLSLTDGSAADLGDLEIRVSYNKEAKTLTIADTGVGMTKQDLINNLGTVAKSGTSNFLEALAQGGDVNLVGQFGVGFYSAYLVADKVVVTTKNKDDKQYLWESSADSQFVVSEDPRGDTLGRGTRVTLHLKSDATDFATERQLKDVIKKYSQFIPHPIYLSVEKTKKVPVDPEDKTKEGKKNTKSVTYMDWEHMNAQKAIWLRPKEELNETDYNEFYRSFSRDWQDPLAHIHFTAEGEVEFKSILFIPSGNQNNAWAEYFSASKGLKLFVRRVLVSDTFDDLTPKWLHWVKGVVDSDDLPLKVDREQLSQNKVMKSISKKVVRKILELIKKIAKDDEQKLAKKDEEDKDKDEKDKKKDKEEPSKYEKFLEVYGRNLKLGCVEDEANRPKVVKLLRYQSSNDPKGRPVSLDKYIESREGKEGQKPDIYFMATDNLEMALQSPLLKPMMKKNIPVLILTDPTDESCLVRVTDYEGHKLVSLQKGDVKLDADEEYKKRITALNKYFQPLLDLFCKQSSLVSKCVISNRQLEDPAVVVAGQHGYSAHMEKVLKTQTFADRAQLKQMAGSKVMEVNPDHPIIQDLMKRLDNDGDDPIIPVISKKIVNTAFLASGFELEDPTVLSSVLYKSLAQELNVDDAELKEIEIPEKFLPAEAVEIGDDDVEEIDADDKDEEETKEDEKKEEDTKEDTKEEEKEEEKKDEL